MKKFKVVGNPLLSPRAQSFDEQVFAHLQQSGRRNELMPEAASYEKFIGLTFNRLKVISSCSKFDA